MEDSHSIEAQGEVGQPYVYVTQRPDRFLAFQWTGNNKDEAIAFLRKCDEYAGYLVTRHHEDGEYLQLPKPHGGRSTVVEPGAWVVYGDGRKWDVLLPSLFEKTYSRD